MRKILVTGFEPFSPSTLNPSGEIIKALQAPDLVTEILPVVFGKATLRVVELIELHEPYAVLCLGQAAGRYDVTPERVAVNFKDAPIADNEGNVPRAQRIIDGAPDGYFSTLPIELMVEEMKKQGIPASISLSAGTFVCNDLFYAIQHFLKGSEVRSGFMHVPLMDEQRHEFPNVPTMPLKQLIASVEAVLNVLRI